MIHWTAEHMEDACIQNTHNSFLIYLQNAYQNYENQNQKELTEPRTKWSCYKEKWVSGFGQHDCSGKENRYQDLVNMIDRKWISGFGHHVYSSKENGYRDLVNMIV